MTKYANPMVNIAFRKLFTNVDVSKFVLAKFYFGGEKTKATQGYNDTRHYSYDTETTTTTGSVSIVETKNQFPIVKVIRKTSLMRKGYDYYDGQRQEYWYNDDFSSTPSILHFVKVINLTKKTNIKKLKEECWNTLSENKHLGKGTNHVLIITQTGMISNCIDNSGAQEEILGGSGVIKVKIFNLDSLPSKFFKIFLDTSLLDTPDYQDTFYKKIADMLNLENFDEEDLDSYNAELKEMDSGLKNKKEYKIGMEKGLIKGEIQKIKDFIDLKIPRKKIIKKLKILDKNI